MIRACLHVAAVFALLCVIARAQAPVSAPFFENFDSFGTCAASTTTSCPLNGVFEQDPNDAGDWVVDNGGTTSVNTGPSVDHTTGTASGNYLYTETSGAVVGSERRLLSPRLDLTSAINPTVSFWYHMFGGQMGLLHIDTRQQINEGSDAMASPGGGNGTLTAASAVFSSAQPGDAITIAAPSINAGTYTVTAVLAGGAGVMVSPDFIATESNLGYLHERETLDVVPSFTDNLDLWQRRAVPLAATLAPPGNAFTTRVIIRGVAGTSFESDMAIDDFSFFDGLADDLRPTAVTSPSPQTCTGSFAVTVNIENAGSNAQVNFPVSLFLNGATVVTDTIPSLAAGLSLTHTFSVPVVLPAGNNTLDVLTGLVGDLDPTNDLISLPIVTTSVISTFPYFEDFENGTAGWGINGATTTWAFGTPANTVITGASSGANAFATGNLNAFYSNNENGFVRSPCFDISGLAAPAISLRVWWDCDFSDDGANLQASVDGGLSWNDVGMVGDPDNWFNDATIIAAPGGSQFGWSGDVATNTGSGGYVTAIADLGAFAGATNIEFRINFASGPSIQGDGFAFDDVRIASTTSAFPGSGGDLLLEHGVNAEPDDAPGGEIKLVAPGSFVSVRTSSPAGTYVGFPYALVADSYPTAGGPPIPISPTFPEAHIGASAVVVLDGNNPTSGGGFSWGIGPAGSEINLAVLDPILIGTSVMLQALVLDSNASNGFFTITDAKVFQIQ